MEDVAADFLHHQKADFETEVDRGLARTEVILKSLATPNISWPFFGIPYGAVQLDMQEKLVALIRRTFLGLEKGNDDGLENHDDSSEERSDEVEIDESEDSMG